MIPQQQTSSPESFLSTSLPFITSPGKASDSFSSPHILSQTLPSSLQPPASSPLQSFQVPSSSFQLPISHQPLTSPLSYPQPQTHQDFSQIQQNLLAQRQKAITQFNAFELRSPPNKTPPERRTRAQEPPSRLDKPLSRTYQGPSRARDVSSSLDSPVSAAQRQRRRVHESEDSHAAEERRRQREREREREREKERER